MPHIPFDIPKSLFSYVEQFDDDPAKATARLKKQLKKRGPDAAGHFLLAWFYHLRNMNDEAVEEALNAKIFAPGSPFLQKLHYYLSHPYTLRAWTPRSSPPPRKKTEASAEEPGPVLNLDSLISRLSKVETKRIRPKDPAGGESTETQKTDDVDDIASETLAVIHEKQGKIDAAITIYKRLRRLNKGRSDFYDKEIVRLQNTKEYQAEE